MPDRVKDMVAQLDAHAEEAQILLPRANVNYAGNSVDAWWGSEDTEISVSDKILHIHATGPAPSVETNYNPNMSDGTFLMEFEMKSGSEGSGSLSWKEAGNKDYLAENSTPFESINDGQWHKYSVRMPLGKTLSSIRIQPSSGTGDIEIREIFLRTEDGYYLRDWPMY